jgi:uncharacterized protein (DUF1499 family)
MRRLIIEEPCSHAATWSWRIALFSCAVAGFGILIARTKAFDAPAGVAVVGAAIALACIAVLFAATAAVIIWKTGRNGAGSMIAAFVFAGLVLGYPAFLSGQALRLPLLNDVSTDINDPPEFSLSRNALAARDNSTPERVSAVVRQAQRKAYPDVRPIFLDADAGEAYQLVLKAVAMARWRIVEQTPPGGRLGIGHIDAIDRTLVLGLPLDITIRIRPLADQTRVDIRSVSRYGRHDFGVNAKRIAKLAEDIQTLIDEK